MASNLKMIRSLNLPTSISRCFSTSQTKQEWLSKLMVRKIEPTKESHSLMLSSKELVYSLQTHNFKADCRTKYLENVKNHVQLFSSIKEINDDVDLVGSWTVNVGDQDQALHLWQFRGGFKTIDETSKILEANQDFIKLQEEQSKLMRSRHLQYLLAFSYWPGIEMKPAKNIYEIRSYALKPGTMIEWGNNWARAIKVRQNNQEPFAGFFSQIGRLYNVHHIWCYKDLNARKETRESAWRQPGWDECVAYTVPLIREMHCRILVPTEFSPTQ